MTAFEYLEKFEEGRECARKGGDLNDCPYHAVKETSAYTAFKAGFEDQKNDYSSNKLFFNRI